MDHRVDLRKLPFESQSFDFVFASHVLEHIDDDRSVYSEIRRILKQGGTAVLPVPIYGERTVEYGHPNENEHGHVRAPGVDYFSKFSVFDRLRVYSSTDFPERFQTYLKFIGRWENIWPPEPSFLRRDGAVKIMPDFVPVYTA